MGASTSAAALRASARLLTPPSPRRLSQFQQSATIRAQVVAEKAGCSTGRSDRIGLDQLAVVHNSPELASSSRAAA
jgi:hypothetical protein